MRKQFIQLKQFTHDSNKGFTLLELLIALIVSSIIFGLSLKLIGDQRQLFVQDQTRTQVNQNLRAPMDLVGTDIKQAGERLVGNTQLPVVKIIYGGATGSDELVLQRKVIDQVLPVCQTITAGTTQNTIDVSVKGGNGNCTFSGSVPAANPTGGWPNNVAWPDNLKQWQNARCSKDSNNVCDRTTNVANDGCMEWGSTGTDRECLWAYIYNPVTNKGEFFLYAFEAPRDTPDTSSNIYRIYRAPSATPLNNTWLFTYTYNAATPSNNPVLYILEERDYKLVNNPNLTGDKVLQLILNQKTTINLANQLKNFKVFALMSDGSNYNDFNNPAIPTSTKNWQQIQAMIVTITANSSPSQQGINAPNPSATSKFYPRNAGSKQ